MKIQKVLNNNVAISLNEKGEEIIVMGLGLAFGKKVGDTIEEQKIEKTFVLTGKEISAKLQSLMQTVPVEYLMLSESIIEYAKTTLNWSLNDIIYLTLTDHIAGAMERYKKGIKPQNPLFWDVQQLYPEEFALGKQFLIQVQNQYSVQFPDDEAAYIALHFVNARTNNDEDMSRVHKATSLIKQILTIIRYHFQLSSFPHTFEYYQLLNLIKYIVKQILDEKEPERKKEAIETIAILEYPEIYECVEKIKTYLQKKYNYQIDAEQKLLLCIYLSHIL